MANLYRSSELSRIGGKLREGSALPEEGTRCGLHRPKELRVSKNQTQAQPTNQRTSMKAHKIRIQEDYFGRLGINSYDNQKFLLSVPDKPPITKTFLDDLQARTMPQWIVPFSRRAKKYAMLAEYHERPRYVANVGGETWTSMSKAALPSTGLTQRMQRRAAQLQSNAFDPIDFLEKSTDPVIVTFVEDVLLLIVQLVRSRSAADLLLAVTVFIKLRTGKSITQGVASVLSAVIEEIQSPQLQSNDTLDGITDVRSLIAKWEHIQNSYFFQRISAIYKYAMALGVLQMVGVNVDERAAFAAKKELDSPLLGVNFVATVLDTVATLIQRSLLFAKSGEWETLIFGPKSFGNWFDACQKVKREYQHRGDLEAQGTSYHQFIADLRKCIEDGKSILKFGDKATGYELLNVKRLLNEMLMLEADITTYKEAQKSRRPPFSLLVHGKTCVGKSTFTSMLYSFAGKLLNLPVEDEFRYTRNSCDDFWSGWDSMKWFLLLDDIAFCDPNGNIVDNSLKEVIQIMNDVPLVPNQAALEDKGKNPMRARMCIATTNTKHLNAHAYFSCPVAVQRRFPFVLTVSPKTQYARPDDPEMINPASLPPIVGDWPDYWNITVERVVAAGANMAQYQVIERFTNSHDFLRWFAHAVRDFEAIQARAGAGVAAMRNIRVCPQCFAAQCTCNGENEPVGLAFGDFEPGELDRAMDGPQLQARSYPLPIGQSMGSEFTQRVHEGNKTWTYKYVPYDGGEYNYMLLTTVTLGGEEVERRATPICVVAEEPPRHVQASDIEMAEVLAEIVARQVARTGTRSSRVVGWVIDKYLQYYSKHKIVRRATHYMMEWQIARTLAFKLLRFKMSSGATTQAWATWTGNLVSSVYMSKKWRYVLAGLAAASACLVAYNVYQAAPRRPIENTVTPVDDAAFHGLRMSTDDSQFPKTEKENVWKRDDYQTSTLDRSEMSASFASLPLEQILKVVERNTARIKCVGSQFWLKKCTEANAFSPGGHLWMTNNHVLDTDGDLNVTLSVTPHIQGASATVTFKLRQEDIFRMPEKDIAFFEVFSWETKRDLRELVSKPTLKGAYTATYVVRDKGVTTRTVRVKCAASQSVYISQLDQAMMTWSGIADEPTVVGDCGSPLVCHQPVTAILGIHQMGGDNNRVWATAFNSDDIGRAYVHFASPVIQCAHPVLSAPSSKKTLAALRQYSPLRWLEAGSIACYGSFVGFKGTPRSKVRPTLLGKSILEQRGWDVPFTAPKLDDWRPWRLALLDATQKKFGALSPKMMKEIARAFADDIIEGLDAEKLKILEPLSDKATINGLPGVRFIDKMNFKSSMGEPYNRTKKGFLEGTEGDMKFVEEINDRIAHILGCYAQGQRASPVFSAQLKDEPRHRDKVAQGKVRVFTAAPADWSFVVRKFLLPFAKLMQENPFVFESSPGCTAQSQEWQAYYVYLVQHGVARLIAGDYGKFDKKMEALIILMAFYIIRCIFAAAGWSEEELVVIDCIAEDTAYAYINFNGDLVMFFGSNPSGHPFTVIINCLVNCLYMRFAFVKLSPFEGSVYEVARMFKRYVCLLTYGDDNAMGVSPLADWFNHTAIQDALESIGVEYTMADKESGSRPFIHIREVAYLKRTWRWDEDVGAVVCPLEEGSIHKMLTICNPSDTESPELHMASVMSSAINEWFWYGRERFEKERAWLIDLAKKNNLYEELKYKGCPSWDALYERYWSASAGVTGAELGCLVEHPRSLLPN